MKRLFTGLQPSGQLHIGNYFGALKPFTEMYGEYESFLMVVDYHALTSLKDPKELRQNIVEIVRGYLAAGVDPNKAVIFKQSDVGEHTELAWIFECLVTVPFLMQAHAYKDKVAKGLEASAGLFNYPMLMAADILLYDTEVVPVGQDQRQHVEYAREAASKFNLAFGQTFIEPKAKILETVATVPGTDGQKMSKSYKNTIPLFGSRDEIAKAVMSIVTDSSGEVPANVYAVHKLFRSDLDSLYAQNKGNYKALKEALIEDIETLVGPMRTKYESISEAEVKNVLAQGAAKAKGIAATKMVDVRKKVGVTL
jgi:tryptophanyl-tRNA synthetase